MEEVLRKAVGSVGEGRGGVGSFTVSKPAFQEGIELADAELSQWSVAVVGCHLLVLYVLARLHKTPDTKLHALMLVVGVALVPTAFPMIKAVNGIYSSQPIQRQLSAPSGYDASYTAEQAEGRYDPKLMFSMVKYHHAALVLTVLTAWLRRPWTVPDAGPKVFSRLVVALLVGLANVLLLWFTMTLARWVMDPTDFWYLAPWSLMRTMSALTCVLDAIPSVDALDKIQKDLLRRHAEQRGKLVKKEKKARKEGNPKKRA